MVSWRGIQIWHTLRHETEFNYNEKLQAGFNRVMIARPPHSTAGTVEVKVVCRSVFASVFEPKVQGYLIVGHMPLRDEASCSDNVEPIRLTIAIPCYRKRPANRIIYGYV